MESDSRVHMVASFNKIAAVHTLLIYHLIDGIDKINAIFSFDLSATGLPDIKLADTGLRSSDTIPNYLRFCLAALFLGGHVYGTAHTQLYAGKHPVMAGFILVFGQLATLWCLGTSVLQPKLLPSTTGFFAFFAVALVWTTFVHISTFVRRCSNRNDAMYEKSQTTMETWFPLAFKVAVGSNPDSDHIGVQLELCSDDMV